MTCSLFSPKYSGRQQQVVHDKTSAVTLPLRATARPTPLRRCPTTLYCFRSHLVMPAPPPHAVTSRLSLPPPKAALDLDPRAVGLSPPLCFS